MVKFKKTVIFLGDVFILYLSLSLTLLFRYGLNSFYFSFLNHFLPFSLIFIIWLSNFYIFDLYQFKNFKNSFSLLRNFFSAISVNLIFSFLLFYFFGIFFRLTPKTNLIIFTFISGPLSYGWRIFLTRIINIKDWTTNLLIIGDSKIIEDTIFDLKNNPLLGYDVKVWLKNLQGVKSEELKKLIFENKIEKIVLSTKNWQENFFQDFFPQLFSLGVEVSNFVEFFESVYQKTPLEEIDGNQLIEQIKIPDRIYDFLKRIIDIILALFLIIIFIPFMLVSICLIKISSPKESVFFKQKRVGQYNKPFVIYKLRTMITQAEKEGPLWTEENDKRITKLGKILRRLYLDETPQLYNILKGELSFVGPRPERIELVQLYQKLPYYHLRHLIKPGLTGWAQINYKPSASVEEAFEKLKYDIYYLKHRSLILDLLIILKTIRLFF